MSKWTIAERTLPDGRTAFVSRLLTGTARLHICEKDDPMSIENGY